MPIASLVSSKIGANVIPVLKVIHTKFVELNGKFVLLNLVVNMQLARKALPESNASVITASVAIHMLLVTMLMNAMLKHAEKMLFVSIHLVPLIVNANLDTKEIHLSCVRSKKPKFVTIHGIVDVVMPYCVLLITFVAKDCARTYVTT